MGTAVKMDKPLPGGERGPGGSLCTLQPLRLWFQTLGPGIRGCPDSNLASGVRAEAVAHFPPFKESLSISLQAAQRLRWTPSHVHPGKPRIQQVLREELVLTPARGALQSRRLLSRRERRIRAQEGKGSPQWTLDRSQGGAYPGGRSPCGSCLSRGCSCYHRPGRRRTCPACGWRRARRHSRWAAGREAERLLGGRRGQGPGGPHRLGAPVGGRRKDTRGTSATTFNNLTFSRHADPSQVGELAGRAVVGGDHELPLAVHGGAVQVTRLAGDVHVVVCRADGGSGRWAGGSVGDTALLSLRRWGH